MNNLKKREILLLRFILYSGALSVLFSYADSWQHTFDIISPIVIAAISSIPFVMLFGWVAEGTNQNLIAKSIVSGISCLTALFIYSTSVVGGPSTNPDTVGHMRIIFFPVLHIIFTLIIVVISLVSLSVLKRIKKNPT